MSVFSFLFAPVVVFLAVVAPIWIIFHYITKWKEMKRAGAGEGQTVVNRSELLKLRQVADKLEDRVESLERILDAESPEWRKS